MPRHYPVLLAESIGFLAIRPEGRYLDATCGMGGHTEAIARELTTGEVIACDRDGESLEMARERLKEYAGRVRFVKSAFSELETTLRELGIGAVDGLLADLGASYYQMTAPDRGFGFSVQGPLDCRMDRSQGVTAAELLNHLSEIELANLIYGLGAERRSRRLARAIVRARPIRTTSELSRLIESVVPRARHEKLHPATRTFMALRIAVNREMEEIDSLLEALPRLVRPGGRVAIISFHSDEDRRVKNKFREMARAGEATLLTKKVVRPTLEEVRENPPSRSGRLRAVEIASPEDKRAHGNDSNTD